MKILAKVMAKVIRYPCNQPEIKEEVYVSHQDLQGTYHGTLEDGTHVVRHRGVSSFYPFDPRNGSEQRKV